MADVFLPLQSIFKHKNKGCKLHPQTGRKPYLINKHTSPSSFTKFNDSALPGDQKAIQTSSTQALFCIGVASSAHPECKDSQMHSVKRQTRDLFKKIRDTKGTFHAKMSTIKDRNGKDLTGAEDIKKRWQEYIEELYKKIFMTQITMMV